MWRPTLVEITKKESHLIDKNVKTITDENGKIFKVIPAKPVCACYSGDGKTKNCLISEMHWYDDDNFDLQHRTFQDYLQGVDPNEVDYHLNEEFRRIVELIQEKMGPWLDKPITKDGKLGIRLRINLREHCQYGNWHIGLLPDKQEWSLFPPPTL
jgi:hypothetical protein